MNDQANTIKLVFAEILVAEISRAHRFLGERITEEQEHRLLSQNSQQLVNEA